jgi:hypothetical protein
MFGNDGRLYAASRSYDVLVRREWSVATFDGQWRRYEPKAEPIHLVTAMAEQSDGTLWLAPETAPPDARRNRR